MAALKERMTWKDFFTLQGKKEGTEESLVMSQDYAYKDTETVNCRDNIEALYGSLVASNGVNFILLPSKHKQVAIAHSIRALVNGENQKLMLVGIVGLYEFSAYLQIPDTISSPLKPRSSTRPSKAKEKTPSKDLIIPSLSEFAEVSSTEDFKSVNGSIKNEVSITLNDLPHFHHLHPHLLTELLSGETMDAAVLGFHVIQYCATGYNESDNPKNKVTKALSDCYQLLIFLWAIEHGQFQPIHLTRPKASATLAASFDQLISKFRFWKDRWVKQQKKKSTSFRSSESDMEISPDEDSESEETDPQQKSDDELSPDRAKTQSLKTSQKTTSSNPKKNSENRRKKDKPPLQDDIPNTRGRCRSRSKSRPKRTPSSAREDPSRSPSVSKKKDKKRRRKDSSPPPNPKKKHDKKRQPRSLSPSLSRSASPPRKRNRHRSSTRATSPARDRAHSRSPSRSRSRGRSRSRQRSRSRSRTRSPSRGRKRSHSRDRDRSRSRSHNRGNGRDDSGRRSRSNSRGRDNRKDRDRDNRRRKSGDKGGGDDSSDSSDSESSYSSPSDDSRRSVRRSRRGDERHDRPRRRSRSRSDDRDRNRSRRERRNNPNRRRHNRRRSSPRRSRSRSRSRDRHHRRSRHGRRKGHHSRSRSPSIDPKILLAKATSTALKLADQQLEAKTRKSLLAQYSIEQAEVVRLASAKNYKDEDPKMNPFMKRLVEDKNLIKAQLTVAAETRSWEGQIYETGIANFLSSGYASHNIKDRPSGFTAFMCGPKDPHQSRSQEERKMLAKSLFGDTKLDDATLKWYTRAQHSIPSSIYELELQLKTTVQALELFTARGGIAVQGYAYGLDFLQRHRLLFVDAIDSKPLFGARFLHMLDRIFQSFILRLGRYHARSHPIRKCREELEGSMEDAVKRAMHNFDIGVIPDLPLPKTLTTVPKGGGGGGKAGGKDKDNKNDKIDKSDKEKGKSGRWKTNTNVNPDWALPKGKVYKDYFDSRIPAHEKNIKGWPRLPHHKDPTKIKAMCIKFQSAGLCPLGMDCVNSHVNHKELGKDDHTAIDTKYKEVYIPYTSLPPVAPSQREPPSLPNPWGGNSIPFAAEQPDPEDHALGFNLLLAPDYPPSDTELHQRRHNQKKAAKNLSRGTHPKERTSRQGRTSSPRARNNRREPIDDYSKRKAEDNNSRRSRRKQNAAPTNESDESDDDTDHSRDEENLATAIPDGLTRKQRRELLRNIKRIRKANRKDKSTIGKYFPKNLEDVFTEVVHGADDHFTPPPWLLEAVSEVASLPAPVPESPPVIFDTTQEALDHNSALIKEFDFDFERLLSTHNKSTLGYGSEFRPTDQLKKILGKHPNFPFFQDVLHNGMKYHFKADLSEEERVAELKKQMERGNHKSANDEVEIATNLLYKDVAHGFALPVHANIVDKIPGAMVQPGGVAHQFKLQADGSRKLAARLTHDLSHSISKEDASVNKRINMELYTEMIYGWCLTRIIHFIVALRLRYPNQKIFIAKYDYSDAYRRVVHAASAAVQTILILADVAYIMLRLAFGGSPNPPTWCAFSEMVTDLSNEIDLCDEWDPEKLRSPSQPTTPIPESLPDSVPFGAARPLAVDVPIHGTSRTDSFIDDLIRIFLDTTRNRARAPHSVPLAIHVTSRPHSGETEPIKRRDILSGSKLEAEGLPVEIQVVLGWDLDTRRLMVLLPDDKYIAWSGDLEQMIRSGKVSFGDLDSMIGRLNHVAYLIPLSRHFLPRLRARTRSRRHQKQIIQLSKEEVQDMILWSDFLSMAHHGISMNRLTIRPPSRLGFGDSCPMGLGGVSHRGTAYRIMIPPESPIYGVSEANNVFEFLAMALLLWIIILECEEEGAKEECILVLADSTSALGWLYKIRYLPQDSFYTKAIHMIARKIASLIINSSHFLASQHIRGMLNVVADLLSYDGVRAGTPHPLAADRPDNFTLTTRFHSHLSQFIPESFNICQLPDEILSFATLVLQTTELSYMVSKNLLTSPKTEPGAATNLTAPKWVSPITSSSLVYPTKKENWSPDPSFQCTVKLNGVSQETVLESVKTQWLRTLSDMPQAIWLRRFGTISNKAPFTSKGARGSYPPSHNS